MRRAQFGLHNPIANGWARIKTIVTKTLTENFLLFTTIQTLVSHKIDFQILIQ
jgi:hypothetical protein